MIKTDKHNTKINMRLAVFCTISTGLDAVATVLRNGYSIQYLIGLNPQSADPEMISGYVDIAEFAKKWNVQYLYVNRYELKSEEDRKLLSSISMDLIWVAGWQRLIPEWLINIPKYGAIGGHGSPEGISGGRGRSPQNWAIILGAKQFDLSLFSMSSGVDDGPVILEKSFFYEDTDDIQTSYKKSALCMGEMVVEVLKTPEIIRLARPQETTSFYYPQRKPEDGYVDWSLTRVEITSQCRALTKPYPGLRSKTDTGKEITIWNCVSFDDKLDGSEGLISHVFEDGAILVNCGDGRLLINDFKLGNDMLQPKANDNLISVPFSDTMHRIIKRHEARYPELIIAKMIKNLANS